MLITRSVLGRIIREEAARLQEAPRKGTQARKVESGWKRKLATTVDAAMKDVGFLTQGEKAAAADELEKKLARTIEEFVSELQSVEDEDDAYGKHLDSENSQQSARRRR